MAKFCAAIECVERAVDAYIIESKKEAEQKVTKALEAGIGEVFAEFAIVSKEIIDTYDTANRYL